MTMTMGARIPIRCPLCLEHVDRQPESAIAREVEHGSLERSKDGRVYLADSADCRFCNARRTP